MRAELKIEFNIKCGIFSKENVQNKVLLIIFENVKSNKFDFYAQQVHNYEYKCLVKEVHYDKFRKNTRNIKEK